MANTILGMTLQANSALPEYESVYKLAPGDYIGEEFRKKMQAWCDEFFGTQVCVYILDPKACGIFSMGDGRVLVMHPNNIAKLRAKWFQESVAPNIDAFLREK